MNHDGLVDLEDVELFSSKKLKEDWQVVDWCQWLEQGGSRYERDYGELLDFIWEWFDCGHGGEPNEPPPTEDPFRVENVNRYPTRLAYGSDGRLFVSDAKVGSVFIYDPNLVLIGELKGLNKPLGVAVDDKGNIYVGNNGSDNVEVYDSNGVRIATIGEGVLKMPNDLALDRNGNLYVVDTLNHTVWVYDSNQVYLRNIGVRGDDEGEFRFPTALTVAYPNDANGQEVAELFVADQGHKLVQVFGLQGNFIGSYGGEVTQGMMDWKWKGKFVKLQSLAVDSYGRLHAADCYMNKVQILDAQNGDYMDSYGTFGTGVGKLNLPLDIAIDDYGQVVVTNTGNRRVEIVYTIP
jgi:hypothetical protein